MDRVLTVAIIGTGSRGNHTYGQYMLSKPEHFKVVSLCDILPDRLALCQQKYGLEKDVCFTDEKEFFSKRRADMVVIATPDNCHVRHALMAINCGYDILLEKPISDKEEELYMLKEAAKAKGVKVLVCHVLRYTVAMNKLKDLLTDGSIGELISIDHLENVGYWHQAHSYVRGNWRNTKETTPMILAKCCHDLDLLQWFANSKCESVSSYGKLYFFNKQHQPSDASDRCVNCKYKEACPYSAYRIYIERWKEFECPQSWPFDVLTDEYLTEEVLTKAITEGPYGRCVFACDNDAVDCQSTNIKFKNGVIANLKMTGFTKYTGRYIHFYGTMGELFLKESEGTIELKQFGGKDQVWKISDLTTDLWGHGGGDGRMVDYLYKMITENIQSEDTSLDASIESHLMACKAELSRINDGKEYYIDK